MNVGLIDVDSHNYPNLALMKLSAWHKQQGDVVGWYNVFESYDIVYMSKVFSFTPDYGFVITNAQKVVKGGTGYALHGAGGQTYSQKMMSHFLTMWSTSRPTIRYTELQIWLTAT